MALASDRRPGARTPEVEATARVASIIDMKESSGIVHAPGVVAVLDGFRPEAAEPFIGRATIIRAPGGHPLPAKIEAVRDHGPTISFFFRGLSPEDVPVGSTIEIEGRDDRGAR